MTTITAIKTPEGIVMGSDLRRNHFYNGSYGNITHISYQPKIVLAQDYSCLWAKTGTFSSILSKEIEYIFSYLQKKNSEEIIDIAASVLKHPVERNRTLTPQTLGIPGSFRMLMGSYSNNAFELYSFDRNLNKESIEDRVTIGAGSKFAEDILQPCKDISEAITITRAALSYAQDNDPHTIGRHIYVLDTRGIHEVEKDISVSAINQQIYK